jgi:hypothetical protein
MSITQSLLKSVLLGSDSRDNPSCKWEKPRTESQIKKHEQLSMERAAMLFCEHEGLTARTTMRSSQFSLSRSMEIKTSIFTYLKYLAYHLIYFWLLGPFMILVFWPFNPSKYRYLFFNMGFSFRCYPVFFFQMFNWLCVMQTYYLFFTELGSANSMELGYSILIHSFLRSSSIAIKYTTFSDYQLALLETTLVKSEDFSKEHTLGDWRKQEENSVIEWISDATHFAKIHTSSFFIKFFVQPQEKTVMELRQWEQHADNRDSSIDSKIDKQSDIFDSQVMELTDEDALQKPTYFCGTQIFRFILMGVHKSSKVMLFVLVLSLARISLPIIWDRMIFNRTYFSDCPILTVRLFILELNLAFFILTNIGFYSQAIIDIQRRSSIMKTFKLMLNPYMEKTTKTTLPILDLFDKTSIYGWRCLYTLNLEYGKKFFIRHTMFIPIVFLVMVTCTALLFGVTSYIDKHVHEDSRFVDLLTITMTRIAFDMLILLLMTAKLLIIAASFNELYDEPVQLLRSLIFKMENILNFSDDAMEHYEEKDQVMNALCDELRKRYPEKDTRNKALIDIISYYKVTIDSLESEMQQNILKVANIKITKRLLSSVAALAIPAIFTIQRRALDVLISRIDIKSM